MKIGTHRFIEADGMRVFYREAGDPGNPTLLLLHGFPSSSFQYRHLMPLLADSFHLVAPDLPGFGFTEVPAERHYPYTFSALAETMAAFTSALSLQHFSMYLFDYGAPTGYRLALSHPEKITAIISQNGNAYNEGLSDVWAPVQKYWSDPTPTNRESLRQLLTLEAIKWQYTDGVPSPERVAPESYSLDAALVQRPGNAEIQLDLLRDYAENVKLYPQFQKYFRDTQIPLLAIWGKHDSYFLPAGAEAFQRDLPTASVKLLDTGHFALETHATEIAAAVEQFLRVSSTVKP